MSAHLSRLRLFPRHLPSLVGFGCEFGMGFTLLLTSILSQNYPLPPRPLVRSGQTSPQKPRLVVSYSAGHSACLPLSSSSSAHSFVIGPAAINNNKAYRSRSNKLTRRVGDCSNTNTQNRMASQVVTHVRVKVKIKGRQAIPGRPRAPVEPVSMIT